MKNSSILRYEQTIEELIELNELSAEVLNVPIKEGKWSIKEIIGHLFYWDKLVLEEMAPKMAQGADLRQFPNHDEYNYEAICYIERYPTFKEVMDVFVSTRRELLQQLAKVPHEAEFTIGNGTRQFTTESFIEMFVEHDLDHLKQIKGYLDKIKG